MGLDDLLYRYFGTREFDRVPPPALSVGIERMQVDLALESDSANRFALWCMLHLLKSAPDLDDAFKDRADQDAARNFMDLLAAQTPE